MLKYFTAALAALFFLFPLSAVGESLDLSQLGAIEEAEHWEECACISARTAATGACRTTVP